MIDNQKKYELLFHLNSTSRSNRMTEILKNETSLECLQREVSQHKKGLNLKGVIMSTQY